MLIIIIILFWTGSPAKDKQRGRRQGPTGPENRSVHGSDSAWCLLHMVKTGSELGIVAARDAAMLWCYLDL